MNLPNIAQYANLSIYTMAAAIAFSIYFIELLQIPQRFKVFRRKPFNCQICLPYWLTIAFMFLPHSFQQAMALCLGAGVITVFTIKNLRQ